MPSESDRDANTGIGGLDEILGGGLTPNRIYLVDGTPGAGKTTLALQFLMAGAAQHEVSLYVTLSETEAELRASGQTHGWDLRGVSFREYMPEDASLDNRSELTMFHSSEVELGETLTRMLHDIDELKPRRVIIDALSEFRVLAETPLRYRRQILALKRFFVDRGCTVLMLDDRSDDERDSHVESIAHGVISLEHDLTPYGLDSRRLRVRKFRGRSFRAGLHDYQIKKGGLVVYPRLIATERAESFRRDAISSGISALDALLGGGPQMGTSTLLIGPAGSGKTTVAMQYVAAAAARGQQAAVYMFDELRSLMTQRLKAIGLNLDAMVAQGTLLLRQIDPAEQSPGEFAALVRADVEGGAKMVVIDSLNGYLNSMPHEEFLGIQLHALFAYLGVNGVATILVVGQQGIVGSNMSTPIDASYLVDSVVLFRFFESRGLVRKAISVTKKRGGGHENVIRELVIDSHGVRVGDPLSAFHGILTGVPATFDPAAVHAAAPKP
jgi:circadian clock protein KaiC